MRYFLAITPPLAQTQAVLDFRQQWGLAGIVPHITVKAPCGLAEEAAWLPIIQQHCQVTAAPVVRLQQTGVFEPAILYWRVESPALHALHRELIRVLRTSPADQAACFEGEQYTPHLTLAYLSSVPIAHQISLLAAAADLCQREVEFVATTLTVYGKNDGGAHRALVSIPFAAEQ
jgi:2'-5' RNA ligase